ncbi:DUF255 family protein [Tieghemostelium lacteum]|uniref:DUF255 family protein n=1 Tax=Tieghemostelium lacteum TaxID=361077 RepID=A0A152A8H7_TIELA|nr:DUF255 family protein [Tieghemostelium lacteum]|eukprot:KYR02526.1 DUF255 family protein [Tieghemostelium lacteum]
MIKLFTGLIKNNNSNSYNRFFSTINNNNNNNKEILEQLFKNFKEMSKDMEKNTTSSVEKYTNRLINEKSPYLLQHAHQPVEWFAWGEDAFKKAREQNKLIFLSIGYSTCHWCHVMAHESFDSPEIAKVMNDLFVNIKVDREERPDIDKIYMTYVTEITGSGGWPLSVWLTPQLEPITGGTYYAPTAKYGRPGFPVICEKINEAWKTDKNMVLDRANSFSEFLKEEKPKGNHENALSQASIDKCLQKIIAQFDEEQGGFSGAPKFPRTSIYNFLHYVSANHNVDTLKKLHFTLEKMANGGIYDHLGGGFHRYSVTADWKVPHFEKMLYDQGQIANVYLDAFQQSGNKLFESVARGILEYVQRDLTHKDLGGFYSAEDADSLNTETNEKSEGAFYIWGYDELVNLLSNDELELFIFIYGQTRTGNVDPSDDPHNEFTGKNIVMRFESLQDAEKKFKKPQKELEATLKSAERKLFEHRSKNRARPHLDDKIITAWNGLMISAFAKAYVVFGMKDQSYLDSAERALAFIKKNLYDPITKTLIRNYREGPSNIHAFADDYAFLIQALLDLYESTFKLEYLQWAIELQNTLDSLFWDETNGGYFSTDGLDQSLISRMKEDHDGAEPSAQSVTVCNLVRLYNITKLKKYEDNAKKTLESNSLYLEKVPIIFPQMVVGLSMYLNNFNTFILVGNDLNSTKELLNIIHSRYLPNKAILVHAENDQNTIDYFKTATENQTVQFSKQLYNQPTLYLCNSTGCLPPIYNPNQISDKIKTL